MPLRLIDYLISAIPLGILALFLGLTFVGADIENKRMDRAEKIFAEHFWVSLLCQSPIEGRNENGDCFLFAIHLRDLIKAQTGEDAQFVFVRWTELDPQSGPTIHVYTQVEAVHQLWVIDNMGNFGRFQPETKPKEWMQKLGPKGYRYHIIGDTKALVEDISRPLGG